MGEDKVEFGVCFLEKKKSDANFGSYDGKF